MKTLACAISAVLVTAAVALAQTPPGPNAPKVLQSAKLPGLEVRFLDFRWDPAVFDGLEKGGSSNPVTKRSWAVARIIPYERTLVIGGAKLRAGTTALLVLNPNLDGKGMTVELRGVDMRDEEFQALNVVAEPPAGKSLYKAPARFDTVDAIADRMTLTLTEDGGKVRLGVHYGNRLMTLEFTS
jgi:hypothetical protein